MVAYLRSDLWVKQCIYQAESRVNSPHALSRLRARADFGRAVALGAVSTVIYTLAMAILFVPHVLACVTSYYTDLCLCRKVRQQFYLSLGRAEGASVATCVALVSIFRTQFSQEARVHLNARLDRNWIQFKTELELGFRRQREEVTARRLRATASDEIYRPYGNHGKSYYEMLAEESERRVVRHSQTFQLGSALDCKYERYEEAWLQIDRFANRKAKELRALPVTYLDVGSWRLHEAARLQRRTLHFLSEQADREVARQKSAHPRKFNSRKFYAGVATLRQQIKGELEVSTAHVKKEQERLKQLWKSHVHPYQKIQREFQTKCDRLARQERYLQWWVDHLSTMPECVVEFFQNWQLKVMMARHQALSALASINGQRAYAVQSIANGVFLTLNSQFFDLERTVGGLVDANGRILKQIDYLTRPAWYARVWRRVSPLFSWNSSWQRRLENWLDPDLS